jgi:hypothetical protein
VLLLCATTPDASQAIRLELELNLDPVGSDGFLDEECLELLVHAEHALHVMADFVRDGVSLGAVGKDVEASVQITQQGQIDEGLVGAEAIGPSEADARATFGLRG